MKRIISLILCICMLLPLLSGCTFGDKKKDADESGKQGEEYQPSGGGRALTKADLEEIDRRVDNINGTVTDQGRER